MYNLDDMYQMFHKMHESDVPIISCICIDEGVFIKSWIKMLVPWAEHMYAHTTSQLSPWIGTTPLEISYELKVKTN